MLKDLLYKVPVKQVFGDTDVDVTSIQLDSREIKAGSCFVAVSGSVSDGHDFISDSIRNGASSIVCEQLPADLIPSVTYVQVESSSKAAGLMSHHFYGEPTIGLQLVGVTGTNG